MSDDRRTQLLELVKKEFIGPDPIEWPGYKQANGEEILVSDPPRTRYIAGILYPQETPVGAKCIAQSAIGVDNPGDFKIHFSKYDGEETDQKAVFSISLDAEDAE